MRKYIFLMISCFFFYILSLSGMGLADSGVNIGTPFMSIAKTEDPPKSKVYKIIIDPGHGGKDAGCSGRHSHEKDIVLSIGKKIRELSKQKYPHLEIIMTRDRDEFIPLHERAKIANQNNADLFISLHCNSIAGKSHVHGSETYVLGLHRAEDNLRVAKRENSSILYENDYKAQYDGFDPSSVEGHILLSMYQNAYLEQSIHFAHLVEDRLTNNAKRHSRGVKQAGFLVLRETTMPAVLIETGFLTHAKEEAFLRDEKGQYKVAESIIQAIEQYAILPTQDATTVDQSTSLRYGVQLAATSSPIDAEHPLRKKHSTLVEWTSGSNTYKYILPAGKNKAQAQQLKAKLEAEGQSGAFIIPWPNDQLRANVASGTK